ncbi:hypothetical protein Q2T76_03070 [Lactobacillus sp. YT155]|uniref:hypothetical protein n=1 Tax=Lactobacillus sp. YT155 TaxID=3060955 RepID=UPI00265F5AC7|nr:hypothetical protein [Lactobacillus sp. YT155]MDO1605034.1 hypothetical protein [Lactobacillus sp. YT155]
MKYFEILGVSKKASEQEIKKAYANKLKKLKRAEFEREVATSEYEELREALENTLAGNGNFDADDEYINDYNNNFSSLLTGGTQQQFSDEEDFSEEEFQVDEFDENRFNHEVNDEDLMENELDENRFVFSKDDFEEDNDELKKEHIENQRAQSQKLTGTILNWIKNDWDSLSNIDKWQELIDLTSNWNLTELYESQRFMIRLLNNYYYLLPGTVIQNIIGTFALEKKRLSIEDIEDAPNFNLSNWRSIPEIDRRDYYMKRFIFYMEVSHYKFDSSIEVLYEEFVEEYQPDWSLITKDEDFCNVFLIYYLVYRMENHFGKEDIDDIHFFLDVDNKSIETTYLAQGLEMILQQDEVDEIYAENEKYTFEELRKNRRNIPQFVVDYLSGFEAFYHDDIELTAKRWIFLNFECLRTQVPYIGKKVRKINSATLKQTAKSARKETIPYIIFIWIAALILIRLVRFFLR